MLTTAEIEQCSLDTALIGKRIKKARKEKQEQLSSGAKKDAPAQNKKSERDMQ